VTLAVVFAYLAVVLAVGALSHRLFRGTGEDWFLATRSIGPFILLMSLFGTHMTAFSLLGASGEGYRTGVGVFSLMASSSALVAPVVFWAVGTRLWRLGKLHGYVTQVQYFRERFDSPALGILLFVVLVLLLVPYLLIGVMGSGSALEQFSDGSVPAWAGSLLVCAVVMVYVTYGGVRGTAWANTFQTLVFMVLGAVTFVWIVREMGGLTAALDRVEAAHPELMVRGEAIPPWKLATYAFLPLSVGMFPHVFMHWLTARSGSSFRLPMVAYPLCIAVVWVPSVLLGVTGRGAVPGLEGPAANSILILMIDRFAPGILTGLLAAGVFAAIMSSLDSQTLSLGSMFTHDVVRRTRAGAALDEVRLVRVGRVFVAVILGLTWALSLVADRKLFQLGVWSFSGFAALFPLVVGALYWRRATRAGALASVGTAAVAWAFFFGRGWGVPGYTVGGTGIMPVAVMFAAAAVALIVVSLATRPPAPSTVARFFPAGQDGRG
jgi:SSS family solute:Na+ symporter